MIVPETHTLNIRKEKHTKKFTKKIENLNRKSNTILSEYNESIIYIFLNDNTVW